MKISEQCRKRTCPCKGCPKVKECLSGCLSCDLEGHANNMGYCSIENRDGQMLYQRKMAAKK